MRFHRLLEDLLGSPEKIRVLGVLIPNPPHLLTGREVAELAGVSPQGALNILRQLELYGLVGAARVGGVNGWSVNEEHYLFRALSPLLFLERMARDELRERLLKRLPLGKIERVVLFGSVATGAERPNSDIDLLVVVKREQDKVAVSERVHAAAVRLAGVFGNGISPLVYSKAGLKQAPRQAFLREVEATGLELWPGRERSWRTR